MKNSYGEMTQGRSRNLRVLFAFFLETLGFIHEAKSIDDLEAYTN